MKSIDFLEKKGVNISESLKLFGDEQTQWLKTQFSSALIDPMVDAIVITFTQPWNYIEKKYDIDIIKQKYESLSKDVDKEKNVFFEALKEYQETNNGKPFNFYFPFIFDFWHYFK